ncbi:MAG: PhoH family protein [Terrimicrobiaceae bacterium]|nr:PhoH family protein [Terrimicrobiaceae bacterium]
MPAASPPAPHAPTDAATIEFENARALQSLYANDEKLLKELEARLNVRLVARDSVLRIDGEPSQIELVRRLFAELDEARRRGLTIRRHEFEYALRSVAGGETKNLSRLLDHKILCSSRKPPIVPKTEGQSSYIETIRTYDITFGIGPAGTGKTYLAMALAVAALKQEKVGRIILTRPAVEAGEALGFLPGDLQEKLLPYLRPLYDALHDMLEVEELQRHMDRGVIEIAPLAYMRGRTLSNAFIILDEAQNTTTEQMFMFLTRLGADSQCVVTGDHTQIDLPRNKRSGLVEAVDALRHVEGIGFHVFQESDVVRHPLVQRILRAYRKHRGLQDSIL